MRCVCVTAWLLLSTVGCEWNDVRPLALLAIQPNAADEQIDAPVVLIGAFDIALHVDFANRAGSYARAAFTVDVDGVPLTDVEYVDRATLRATVPGALPPGTYDVTVRNHDGDEATLARAFTVRLGLSSCTVDADCISTCAGVGTCTASTCQYGPPIKDSDGDGAIDALCGGPDCDDGNAQCLLDCTDSDSDGACVDHDCDDGVAACSSDCSDEDGDGVPLCAGDCNDTIAACSSGACCAACWVTSSADSGAGSLRECISLANGAAGTTIAFAIPAPVNDGAGTDSWWEIALSSALPVIAAAGTVLDGSTQSAVAGDTNGRGPEVELQGGAVAGNGITIDGAADVVVRGLAIAGFGGHGISITGDAANVQIEGCVVGATPTGDAGDRNDGSGVYVNASDAIIGSLDPGGGNLIAHNWERGIDVAAGGARCAILGNVFARSGYSNVFLRASDVLVVGNVIHEGSTRQSWDELITYTNTVVYHNTIHGSPDDGISVEGGGLVLHNNIITGNAGFGLRIAGGSIAIESFNLITDAGTPPANAAGQATFSVDATDFSANPGYTDAGAGDFTLANCASPAVDAGLDLGALQPDRNGPSAGSFDGDQPDLGAHETPCP